MITPCKDTEDVGSIKPVLQITQNVHILKMSGVGSLNSEFLFVRGDRCAHTANPKSPVPISYFELALESRQRTGQQQQNSGRCYGKKLEAFKASCSSSVNGSEDLNRTQILDVCS